jgi:hypothetical protein
MLILAFFDTRFHPGRGDPWRRLREAKPASRQHFPLNLPSTLSQYDLTRPEQTAPVVAMARGAGIDGFVIDCAWHKGAYQHDARLLAPFCQDGFGLGFRWRNEDEEIWQDAAGAVQQQERAERMMATLRDVPTCRLAGRVPFIVDAPKVLAAPAANLAMLRQAAEKAGLPGLYLIANRAEDKGRFLSAGFDALIDPAPDQWHSCNASNRASGLDYLEVMAGLKDSVDYLDRFFPYLTFTVARMLNRESRGKVFPRVFAAFHNWALFPDGGATHLVNYGNRPCDTHLFGLFVENAMLFAHRHFAPDERAVFLQSWNGWMEGSQIEPSLLDGDLVYNAARDAIDRGRYVIRTRGESPGELDHALQERVAMMCEAAKKTL